MEFNGNLLFPFAPPQSRENIQSTIHFTVKFCGGAFKNPGTGGNAGLIKISGEAEACLLRARWSLLISARPRLSVKIELFNCLIFFPSIFPPFENVLPSFIGSTSQSPRYLVPVYLVAPNTCLPTCTVLSVHAVRHARCIPACFCFDGYTWLPPPNP